MEHELASLQSQLKVFVDTFGLDMRYLTVVRGYLFRQLNNPNIVTWIHENRAEYLREFEKISESKLEAGEDSHEIKNFGDPDPGLRSAGTMGDAVR